MIPLTALWLPIVLSAVLVFIASSVIHMLLTYHNKDFGPLPNEDVVRAALRAPPGDYSVPHAGSMEAMKSPEFTQKMKEGPIAFITMRAPGEWNMGSTLLQWFLYCVVISIFAAYVAGRAVPAGSDYLNVFRFASVTAFAGYTLALWQGLIWYGRSWRYTLLATMDGLIYALLTGGVFGWLWPAA